MFHELSGNQGKYASQALWSFYSDLSSIGNYLANTSQKKKEDNSTRLFYLCQVHPSGDSRERRVNENWFRCLPNSITNEFPAGRVSSNRKTVLCIRFQTFNFKEASAIGWYL